MEIRPLEVEGHAGRPLPCMLYETGAEHAAVILPGARRSGYRLGGSPARPDLHYTRALLLEHGFDVLEVWWDYETKPDPGEEWYRVNARAGIGAVGEERVRLLVGRSIGTIALALLPEWADTPSIWISPLLYLAPVREALLTWRGPKLVVAGDKDEAFEPNPDVETFLIAGGDHGLDVGDAAASARALADALDTMRAFLTRADLRLAWTHLSDAD